MSNESAPNKKMARAAMILGMGSLPFLGCAGVVGIIAMVLGTIAYKRANRQPQVYGGKGMAMTGIVCGALWFPLFVGFAIGMDQRRISSNERAAIADVRTVISAEGAYRVANGGHYDTLECLGAPDRCMPHYTGPAFLQGPLAANNGDHIGYKHTLHLGPAPVKLSAGASPSSAQAYVFVAQPIQDGRRRGRTFCGDDSGRVCTWPVDTTMIVIGQCPSECGTLIEPATPAEAR